MSLLRKLMVAAVVGGASLVGAGGASAGEFYGVGGYGGYGGFGGYAGYAPSCHLDAYVLQPAYVPSISYRPVYHVPVYTPSYVPAYHYVPHCH